MKTLKYQSCNVKGSGKLNNDVAFALINLSAEKATIKTDAPIKLKSYVMIDIALDGGIYEIRIHNKGVVRKKVAEDYEVHFLNLPEADKEEISELMKSSCGIE